MLFLSTRPVGPNIQKPKLKIILVVHYLFLFQLVGTALVVQIQNKAPIGKKCHYKGCDFHTPILSYNVSMVGTGLGPSESRLYFYCSTVFLYYLCIAIVANKQLNFTSVFVTNCLPCRLPILLLTHTQSILPNHDNGA